jgi:Flp pilus assembly protein TadD
VGQSSDKLHVLLICIVLAAATIVAYEPVRRNDFVGIDDSAYVTQNPQVKEGLTARSVWWAFTTLHIGNWHPLTWLSHMVDCELFGLEPVGHHLHNLLLHVANTLLLFWVFKRMTGAIWPSAFVAAAFALHPVNVESVAWAAERKDVLSGLFWMLTLAAYAWYAQRPGVGRYSVVVLVFVLGLLAKPMLVTLPFVLLLLDYWPLHRLELPHDRPREAAAQARDIPYQRSTAGRLVAEKIPLFVLVLASSVVTFIAQQRGGAVSPLEKLPVGYRVSNAIVSYVGYLSKMICPRRLAVFYPLLLKRLPMWWVVMCFVLLTAVSVGIVVLRRRRYLTVGWLWYLGTLVPVIGLVQVGSQAMADRYTYLPSVGIFVMVAWGMAELLGKCRYGRIGLGVVGAVVLVLLSAGTRRQVRYWQSSLTLFGRAAEVTEYNFRMHDAYGSALYTQDRYEDAIEQFSQALQINPKYTKARNNLGKTYLALGRLDEAVMCLTEVLRVEKELPDVYSNLGLAYAQLGKNGLAVAHLAKSIELAPDNTDVLNNLAWILATVEDAGVRNAAEAVEHAERACEMTNYERPEMLDTLAAAYAAAGRFSEAVETATKAAKLADSADQKELTAKIEARLQLYKAGQPYRSK